MLDRYMIYYLKLVKNDVVAYKIGITSRSLLKGSSARYSNKEDRDTIVDYVILKRGSYEVINQLEEYIKEAFKDYLVDNDTSPFLNSASANAEVFKTDILKEFDANRTLVQLITK
jgi:hypothetical protein